ncbi:MAG TPA: DUF6088 family protein [Steroidobacteraceae bacterium]|nr:DUF6088 family protein [Steroidobacteraceae bacterium]
MKSLTQRILEYASREAEGVPLTSKALLHLGSRAAVDQALSRLASTNRLLRIGRGLYVRPETTRFGPRPPLTENVMRGIEESRGETVVPHGAAEANSLGLTTQVPVREIFLTSGRTRNLNLGGRDVELRHAPAWQLVLAHRVAGAAVRALAWAGRERAREVVTVLKARLSPSDVRELLAARARLPTWVAREVSTLTSYA